MTPKQRVEMMTDDNRILVVVDPTGSNEQVCVERGAWLAKSLDLGLELLICHYEHILLGARSIDSPFVQRVQQDVIGQRREMLEDIARPLREQGLSVVVSAVWDTPLDEAIVRHVLRTSPRLLVKDTHYHHKIRQAIFSNTDWNLVRRCPVPLWLAKPHRWADPRRIIASVDPVNENDIHAKLDGIILNEAALLAEKLSCELHAFHAYLPISKYLFSSLDSGEIPIDEVDRKIEQDHRMRLDNLLNNYTVSKERTHMLPGYPKQLLPDLATEIDAGLVVIGAIARNALKRVFIGSTTEQVLDKVPCDLLVVKPAWFASSVKATSPVAYEGTREELPSPSDLKADNVKGPVEKAM